MLPTRSVIWVYLPQDRELAAVPDEELRKNLLERYKGWHEPIGTFLANTPDIIRTNIYEAPPLRAWHKDRVVLIGDAAHAMSPSGGQGTSLALEDAMYLVKLLRQFSCEFEPVFAEFERARRPRAAKIIIFPARDITWPRTTPAATAVSSRLKNRAETRAIRTSRILQDRPQ